MIEENVEGFFSFINLRHRIYCRRERGQPWPWTKDKILQIYRFTNVYRDLDAVSVALKRSVIDDYLPWKRTKAAELLGELFTYRFFNWPATYELLRPLRGDRWDEHRAKAILTKAMSRGKKVFTGAYIVSNNDNGRASTRPKSDLYCEAITTVRQLAPKIVSVARKHRTLKDTTSFIEAEVPLCGMFVAYEIVSDLRWTPLLAKAADITTWANAGPGAIRGLNRIYGRALKAEPSSADLVREMRGLLRESQRPGRLGDHMRPLEMRDVEHSLCELDKYLRVKNGEGKPRSKYYPPAG
jgi:hypothetical protein